MKESLSPNARAALDVRSQEKSARAIQAAIVLKTGDAQAGQAMAVDHALPSEELLDRKRVAAASVLEADDAGAHRGRYRSMRTEHIVSGPSC